jgi:hypothetical protein
VGAVLSRLSTAILFGLMALAVGCGRAPEPRQTPLTHTAYVWKQGWDERAATGLSAQVIPEQITELSVLVGECGLAGGTRTVQVPWKALVASGRRVALAVRVGSRHAPSGSIWKNLDDGLGLLSKGLIAAKEAGVTVTGVQVDFDCPTRLLGDYAIHLREARSRIGGMPLSITTLPSWLDAPAFKELVGAVDSWTLQVHGTAKPSLKNPKPLFSAELALGWIDRACRLNKNFRVALPTYAYLACFSDKGTFLGMVAEGSGGLIEGTATTQCLPSRPEEVAKVLEALKDADYNKVIAIDWYRLPLPGDVQTWTVKGLGQVLTGKAMDCSLRIDLLRQGALTDITVVNPTEQPLPLPEILAEWDNPAQLFGADGTTDWEAKDNGNSVRFARRPGMGFLAAGERRVVGWIRLNKDQPVRATVTQE